MLTSASSSRCAQAYEELCQLIPGGVNSGARAFVGLDRTPLIIDYAKGNTLVDLDGRHYLDYCLSWGAIILGHAHPAIVAAVNEQVAKGSTYGITHSSEKRLAKKMIELIPHLQKIRFFSSGTEATMTAIRLARGFTGKDKILKFNGNYHGHADPFLVKAGSAVMQLCSESSSKGVPFNTTQDTLSLPYDDIESFHAFFKCHPSLKNQVAAIILEPIAANMGLVTASPSFLQVLKAFCEENNSLLIFDEVISGFRVGLGDSSLHSGFIPDLSTYGKIIGGGFPAAALGGRAEVMDLLAPKGEVFQAGTLSGNPVAMTAGFYTLEQLEKRDFYKDLFHKTQLLTKDLQLFIQQHQLPLKLSEMGGMFTLFWGSNQYRRVEDAPLLDAQMFKRFFNSMLDQGIYVPPSQFEVSCLSSAHTEEDIFKTKEAILSFIKQHYF